MKKFLLSFVLIALVFGADAQIAPLQVYNGMPFTIRLNSVAIRNIASCTPGATSIINVAIPPNGIFNVAPLQPGNAAVEWAGAKVSDLANTSFLRTIHPYFEPCWLPSIAGGASVMNGYWYPIGTTPTMVLKIYPF